MHISSGGEWPYASRLFSDQQWSEKQNHFTRKPGRKLHLFNTVRGLSLPAQRPWPFLCPGLSICWLPPAWLGVPDKRGQLPWEPLRAERRSNTIFGLYFKGLRRKRGIYMWEWFFSLRNSYRLKRKPFLGGSEGQDLSIRLATRERRLLSLFSSQPG